MTNQSCVGKGLLTKFGLDEIHSLMQEQLLREDSDAKLDAIFSCLSTKEQNDPRMKPNPGMILEAFENLDVFVSFKQFSVKLAGHTRFVDLLEKQFLDFLRCIQAVEA